MYTATLLFGLTNVVAAGVLNLREKQHLLTDSVDAQQHDEDTFIDRSIFGRRSQLLDMETQADVEIFTAETEYGIFCGSDNNLMTSVPFQGIASFAHLPVESCLTDKKAEFDIAIVGAPFDLGVTYRPGARFGPAGARMGSRRLEANMGYSMNHKTNPFKDWAKVVDCGDIPNSPFDKVEAIKQLQRGSEVILGGKSHNTSQSSQRRAITIGGDHTISLPAIRALRKTWGPVAVLHFDSHLDTWDPVKIGGAVTKYSEINHGSMFHILADEGALINGSNLHLGSRSMLFDQHSDMANDARCGFGVIKASDLDVWGVDKVIERVKERVRDLPVYVSIDIDSLDPAFAPATGTLEAGGWTTREMLQILRGLAGSDIKIVGADIVEFTPIYDSAAEISAIAVSQIAYELLQWMVAVPVKLSRD